MQSTNLEVVRQTNPSEDKAKNPEVVRSTAPAIIQALTPMFISLIGGVIGFTVLVLATHLGSNHKTLETNLATAGIGLAGTALGAGAGLAQSSKSEPSKN
ncbi:hypothetical protein [Nostoc sp. PCC 9305]|uniref:hypothetical protein n=1 Tax=Nostoc sp. PCC 9305 TaxID=296636 RepID=UPI0039C62B1B